MPKKKNPDADVPLAAAPSAPTETKPRDGSKQALLCDLMRREAGASLEVLTSATGWQPHTVRAALTGLRKRGFEVVKEKVPALPATDFLRRSEHG